MSRNKVFFPVPNEPSELISCFVLLPPKAVPQLVAGAQIQLIDITPEEAQKLITQQVTLSTFPAADSRLLIDD